MSDTPERPDGSKTFDGREAARQLYSGPTALSDDATAPPRENVEGRVPFDPHLPFHELRRRCVAAGERYGEPYEALLSTLRGIEPLARHEAEESRGASYRRLRYVCALAGLSWREGKNLVWIAERVEMSNRFAGHIIASLKRGVGGDSR